MSIDRPKAAYASYGGVRTANFTRLLLLILLLALPITLQAQFTYTTNNGTITITKFTGHGGTVIIPNTINGMPVTIIGSRAFYQCYNLTSITIPNSVTIIGGYVFYDCFRLASVTIGNSVTNIATAAFYECSRLTSIIIPDSVSNLGSFAFYHCTSLTNVIIGNHAKLGQLYVFESCSSLKSIYFRGNAPGYLPEDYFRKSGVSALYYLPGTTGWGSTCGGRPTKLWNPHPLTMDASFGVRTNQFGFTIAGTTGITFVVEACTNLIDATWFPVQTNTLYGDTADFSDPDWTNNPLRFYRFRAP